MKNKTRNNKTPILTGGLRNMGIKNDSSKMAQRREGYVSKIVPKAISRTRADIASWKSALRSADNVENPKRTKLYNLYNDALLDAHLTSQIELRMQHVLSTSFVLKRDNEISTEETNRLKSSKWINELNRHILWSVFFGHTLVELTTPKTGYEEIEVTLFPRNNVVPEKGILLLSEDVDAGIDYRNTREYGTWILEFGEKKDFGLLNKAVPHALFKRFAESCWSELCEIYGIPPRFIKTDTQDVDMLNRAETMLRDMGSAAYFIIDTSETFEFAKGADTNGDVYNNLISLCNSEMSLLVNGAVIGQDTRNGNRSKEETSLKLLDKIIQADKQLLSNYWNNTVIPALVRIGFIPEGLTFSFQPEEDLEKLWKMTSEILPYMDVDHKWIKDKFGIEVTGKKEPVTQTKLNLQNDFFD